MRITVLAFLTLWFTAGCVNFKNLDYYRVRKRSDIISKNFRQELVFYENRPLIVIPVEIRGKTYDFIFDTGASTTVISRELANELQLKKKADVVSGDSKGNRREMMVSLMDTLSIAGVHFGDVAVAVVDWPDNSIIKCIGSAGLIGNNLIRHCNWLVDYKEHKLVLSDSSLEKEGMQYVEMKYPNGRPYISLKADSLEINNCLLDLGSAGSLDVSRAMVKNQDWNWEKYPHVYDIDGSSQGLFGSNMDTTIKVKVDSVSIGGYRLHNTVIDIETYSGSKIGQEILDQALLHLDYDNARVGFLPYDSIPQFPQPEERGFAPMLDSAGLYVASIVKGSQLWEKGIRYGDRILKLNGRSAADFDHLCDFVDFLINPARKSEEEVSLIMADEPDVEIKIAKRNLWVND